MITYWQVRCALMHLYDFFYKPLVHPCTGNYCLLYELLQDCQHNYCQEGVLAAYANEFAFGQQDRWKRRGFAMVDTGRGLLIPQSQLIKHILTDEFKPIYDAEMQKIRGRSYMGKLGAATELEA